MQTFGFWGETNSADGANAISRHMRNHMEKKAKTEPNFKVRYKRTWLAGWLTPLHVHSERGPNYVSLTSGQQG